MSRCGTIMRPPHLTADRHEGSRMWESCSSPLALPRRNNMHSISRPMYPAGPVAHVFVAKRILLHTQDAQFAACGIQHGSENTTHEVHICKNPWHRCPIKSIFLHIHVIYICVVGGEVQQIQGHERRRDFGCRAVCVLCICVLHWAVDCTLCICTLCICTLRCAIGHA